MKAPALPFLRRTKNQELPLIDPIAVAIAHHRRYHSDIPCMTPRISCTAINDEDREYAEEMVDVLRWLPDFTT